MTTQPIINIALTNLHQYVCGTLNFTWLALPATAEEIAKAHDAIKVSHDGVNYYDGTGCPMEEAFITDYECDFYNVGEYESIEKLNDMAEKIQALEDHEADIVKALINDGYSLEEALEKYEDCYFYEGDTMAEVAENYAEETGLLDSIPENLRYYFDFEAYGRDMELEGHWIQTDNGFIEVV